MDATRSMDGEQVMLKSIPVIRGRHELELTRRLSSPELRLEPRNHCVPLLDTLDLPGAYDQKLIVMPFLRPFDEPHFRTYGEFVAFFIQMCEVSQPPLVTRSEEWAELTALDPGSPFFARAKYRPSVRLSASARKPVSDDITFRDCTANNIMLDPSGMYPQGFHPVQIDRRRDFKGKSQGYDRTHRPPRYYLIDFGLSRQYSSRNAVDNPVRGGDKSAPEHQLGRQCNPFHTDIYHFGNLIRLRFMKVYAH
jgi:serine/threonine protein kinase